ncbi:6-pyruvoyl trahydropterin synthase family protein [Halorubrum laminariae]|uniref:6-pyruvoyl tetrahydropterin synthase family protein n=1 Tax=Halorubrum laminariae TaxID=1433523 RepID=A0ABD6BXT7_9EURY|nr:6-carboxytetrahydropterin synthase [Halorubrum laminariae]
MYATTVTTEFVAQHYLTVVDDGPESVPHSHQFAVELTFRGPALNEHDYLVDIDDADAALADIADRYRDALLNDFSEFDGRNPSVERFARVIFERVTAAVTDDTVSEVAVTVWEDDDAGATYDGPV